MQMYKCYCSSCICSRSHRSWMVLWTSWLDAQESVSGRYYNKHTLAIPLTETANCRTLFPWLNICVYIICSTVAGKAALWYLPWAVQTGSCPTATKPRSTRYPGPGESKRSTFVYRWQQFARCGREARCVEEDEERLWCKISPHRCLCQVFGEDPQSGPRCSKRGRWRY